MSEKSKGEPQSSEVLSTTAPEALVWEVHLGRLDPTKKWVVLGVGVLAAVLGLLMFQHWLSALVGFVAVLLSAIEVFIPLRYRLDKNGATVRSGWNVSTLYWDKVQRMEEDAKGVKLSPLRSAGSRLEPFRGVYLRFNGNREEVLAKIGEFWKDDERLLGD